MGRRWSEGGWAAALVFAVAIIPSLTANLSFVLVPAMVVVSYLAGQRMPAVRAAALAFATGALLNLLMSFLAHPGFPFSFWLPTVVLEFAAVILPWWVGRYRRLRGEQSDRERRLVEDRARAGERVLIARRMHDSLGHELALIALTSGAMELDASASEDQRASAAELRSRATAATQTLHQVLTVLRDDTIKTSPVPAVATIEELVDRARRAGVRVRLETVGNGAEMPDIGPAAKQAAYRVVQEGITNAIKHAPGSSITVAVKRTPEKTILTVDNDAGSKRHGPTFDDAHFGQPSGGHGLAGLAERLRIVGGTCEARAYAGGFSLTTTFSNCPMDVAAAGERDNHDSPSAMTATLKKSRRQSRRRHVQSALLPVSMAMVLAAVFIAAQVATVNATALSSQEYGRLNVGQEQNDIEELLPGDGISEPLPNLRESRRPDGSECVYFPARDTVFDLSSDLYRLCFIDQVLVSKDHLRPGGT